MSEQDSSAEVGATEVQTGQGQQPPVRQRRGSMFDDPVVRTMAWVAVGLVILYLAGIVGALFFGIVGTTAPRSMAERNLDQAEAAVKAGDNGPLATAYLVDSLIDLGRYAQAQSVIDSAPKSAFGGASANVEVSQARLYYAEKNYPAAIKAADAAMKVMTVAYQKGLKQPGTTIAKSYGIDTNFYSALLIKGFAQQDSGDAKAAIDTYTQYLKDNQQDSSVYDRRAAMKAKLNDIAGATADYKKALLYVPNDQVALDGLKKIGAAQ